MSLTASVVILIVLLFRLVLKKAPKIFSYALWAVVLFRLLCPLAIPIPLPIIPEPLPEQIAVLFPDIEHREAQQALPAVTEALRTPSEAEQPPIAASEASPAVKNPLPIKEPLPWLWLSGCFGMLLYGIVRYLRFRHRLTGAVPMEERVYLIDHVDTAFVAGLLRPRIYVPSSLTQQEIPYILQHEKCHLRRLDHCDQGPGISGPQPSLVQSSGMGSLCSVRQGYGDEL